MPRKQVLVTLALLLSLSSAWAQEAPPPLPDDKPSPVEHVQQAGLMSGYPDGRFHPEDTLTRAQLASILVKAFRLEDRKPSISPIPVVQDIPADHWAARDIQTVLSRGIMLGYREGCFYPEQHMTRAEALAIFAQAYGVYQFDETTVESILSEYPDAAQLPDWTRKAIATSLKAGFVDTGESAQIRPMELMTRGDMAFALSQYLDRLHESEVQGLNSTK